MEDLEELKVEISGFFLVLYGIRVTTSLQEYHGDFRKLKQVWICCKGYLLCKGFRVL